MSKYLVKLEVHGVVEIDEPIEADSVDEAVDIAIKEYGNDAWYEFYGDAELIDEDDAYLQYLEEISLEKRVLEEEDGN